MLCPYLAVYLLVLVVLQFVLLFPSYKRKWVNRKCWSDCLITGLTAFMHGQELSTLVVIRYPRVGVSSKGIAVVLCLCDCVSVCVSVSVCARVSVHEFAQLHATGLQQTFFAVAKSCLLFFFFFFFFFFFENSRS